MGLMSDGGVHGHIAHIQAAIGAIAAAGVPVAFHAITDGRDVAPKSAYGYLSDLQDSLPEGARIASLSGRYYAMDRDNRWDRVEEAYGAMIRGVGQKSATAHGAITRGYENGETDEFITPTVIDGYQGARDGDGLFCLNFRADRAREILRAVGEPEFDAFDTGARPDWAGLLGMVDYSESHNAYMTTCYPKQAIVNTLGAWLSLIHI